MKKIRVLIKTLIFISSLMLFSVFAVIFHIDTSLPVDLGEFETSIIDKIELVCGDTTTSITNPDDINEIVSCFEKEIVVRTGYYDLMAIGGCSGRHWSPRFDLVFFADDKKFSMPFGTSCGEVYCVPKDFVKYDDKDFIKSLYMVFGEYFMTNYNAERLAKSLTKYNSSIGY